MPNSCQAAFDAVLAGEGIDVDKARAADLVALLSRKGYTNLTTGPSDPTDCDMVCNATPMGMADGDPLPVAPDLLTPSMFIGDVIAGHGLTPLLAAAMDAGCKTANGGHMVEAVQELMVDFTIGERTS